MKINHLPLTEFEHDLFSFESKSKEIARYINEFPVDVPCAISIDGAWGTGKSTMLNYIEQHLDLHRCSIVRFNPWALSDKEQILFSLFEEIYDCIDNGFTNAKLRFFEYAQKLSKPVSKVATYFAQAYNGIPHQVAALRSEATSEVVGQVTKSIFEKPISKRRKEVEQELESMIVEDKKKIVILIDEIDRMFPDEVIQIFQVIKSVLDLPGLLFVVALDRASINDSLVKVGISRTDDYLHKIFQHNFQIAPRHQLRTLCSHVLLPAMKKSANTEEIEYLIETFIQLNKKNYREPTFEETKKEKENNNSMYRYSLGDTIEKRISESYIDIHIQMRERFENPRKFNKLTNFFVFKWDEFSEFLRPTINGNRMFLQASFLLFITIFEYGDKVDFSLRNTGEKEDKYLETVRSHLEYYDVDGSSNDLNLVIKDSLRALSIFPDMNLKITEQE